MKRSRGVFINERVKELEIDRINKVWPGATMAYAVFQTGRSSAKQAWLPSFAVHAVFGQRSSAPPENKMKIFLLHPCAYYSRKVVSGYNPAPGGESGCFAVF
jgi:hypothetical protein